MEKRAERDDRRAEREREDRRAEREMEMRRAEIEERRMERDGGDGAVADGTRVVQEHW